MMNKSRWNRRPGPTDCYAMRYENAPEVFNPSFSPLPGQQRPELCLLLDWGKSLWRMFCWHDIMQPEWCRRCSSVGLRGLGHWLASGSAVKSLSRLTEPPGQQMFHQPGRRMWRELLAASGYRTPLFWKGFVLKNTTPEITRRHAAASIWNDQPSGGDGGLAFKRRASSSGLFGFEVH